MTHTPPESPAQVFAAHLLAQLVANGVDHIFVAPGARSQSLAIAAGQLAEAAQVQLHVRLDERSLAFQALGVGLVSGFPAAVITTSGTAVANLHPAVLEAHHAGVPMLLLTADRPMELRGVGANQTTNQLGIFGEAVRSCTDVPTPAATDTDSELAARAEAVALEAIETAVTGSGPVQLNLGFREPLSAANPNAADVFEAIAAHQLELEATSSIPLIDITEFDSQAESSGCTEGCDHDHAHQLAEAASKPADTVIDLSLRTVVVAGDGGYLARWYTTGLPLFAEPSSNVRHLPEFIDGYLWALREDPILVGQVQQVLVFGKPTLSRQIQALIKQPGVRVFSEPGRHGVFNPGHNARMLGDDVEFVGEPDPDWIKAWRQSAKALQAAKPDTSTPHLISRRLLVKTVWKGAGKRNPILLGASRLIREADYWAPNKERMVFANRGLAGIDGTVATATGIALTHPGAKVRVLLGDLTLLHDASSLTIDDHESKLNIQLIVGNDNGGSIFEGLEVANNISSTEFDRLFRTPQHVNLELLAAAYGWKYVRVSSAEDLRNCLKLEGRILIEVPLV